jgi:D-alanyl-lipoteichoic acid acyltransferase DltB (MBOAT superfamily)
MLFNSFEFGFFFATCLALYAVLPQRAQNRMLLAASYLFYSAWDWRFCGLLLLSTAIDYVAGLRIAGTDDPRRRRWWVTFSIVANLSILGAFKYAGFFAESLRDFAQLFGLSVPEFALDVVLPVGISFYTFQTMSYSIDVYRGGLAPIRDPFDYALYVAFFPQLVAGPIERARRLLPQIQQSRRVTAEGIGLGLWLVTWGLFKKVVVADNLAPVVNAVYAPGASPTSAELIVATYAFTFQIYCDFSGYSDIARGTGRILGFDIMRNFRLPYAATSPAEYWGRWHISLSTWLRDYVFFSLGGNRGGRARVAGRILFTMGLGGLWHGAAWPFVLWGLFHGGWLILHRALLPWLRRVAPASRPGRAAWHALRVVVTFHLIAFSLLLFRAETLPQIATLLGVLAGAFEVGMAGAWLAPFAFIVAPLILMQVLQARSDDLEPVLRWPLPLRTGVYALVFLAILLFGEDGGQPFIYFQF